MDHENFFRSTVETSYKSPAQAVSDIRNGSPMSIYLELLMPPVQQTLNALETNALKLQMQARVKNFKEAPGNQDWNPVSRSGFKALAKYLANAHARLRVSEPTPTAKGTDSATQTPNVVRKVPQWAPPPEEPTPTANSGGRGTMWLIGAGLILGGIFYYLKGGKK